MPKYSQRSLERLATCEEPLQDLAKEVVKRFDNTVVYGHRTVEEQQELYALGRTKPGRIVTYKDGVTRLSRHNVYPSRAIDLAPYPIRWSDIKRFHFFAGWVLQTAYSMGIGLRWGGDWDGDTEVSDERFVDLPHFELTEERAIG